MDDILSFLLSVNKISLLAFVGVLGFLVYEITLIRREQLKKQKPSIPQFNATAVADNKALQQQAATMAAQKKTPTQLRQTKTSPLLIVVLVVAILLFGGFSVYMVMQNKQTQQAANGVPQIVVNEVQSPGLKVFDHNWNEVTQAQAPALLKSGGSVYIGIQTIDEADIDRARIKVNQKDWNIRDITEKFKAEKKMYYIDYTVASGSSQMKIDAQLHSSSDGWLGD